MLKDVLLLHVPHVVAAGPDTAEFSVMSMPMGFFSIAAEIAHKQISVEIVNLGVEKIFDAGFSIADFVASRQFKIVGLSLHWNYQTYDVLEVAKKIKEKNPDTFILLGGYTASSFPKEILQTYTFVDGVIKGEGEVPCSRLADAILQNKKDTLSDIPNLYWRNAETSEVIANSENWVASKEEFDKFDFIKALDYVKNFDLCLKAGIAPKLTQAGWQISDHKSFCYSYGRGCPVNCTWCGGGSEAVKHITGRTCVTLRDTAVVVKEMSELVNRYGIDEIYMCYDPFPSSPVNMLEIMRTLGAKYPKKITLGYECFGLPAQHFLTEFKRNLSNKSKIIISPDFATEKLRKRHKGFFYSNEQLFAVLDYARQLDIKITLFFVRVLNENDAESIAQDKMMDKIVSKYRNVSIVRQSLGNLEPYSPWWLNPDRYDIKNSMQSIVDYYMADKGYRELW